MVAAVREIPIRISATNETAKAAAGVEQNLARIKSAVQQANTASPLSSGSFNRSDLSAASQKRLTEAMDEDGKSFKEQSRELKSLSRLFFKAGGAFFVIDKLGGVFSGIANIGEKYTESLKSGYSKSEAIAMAFKDAAPAVGKLAQGFRDILTSLQQARDGKSAEQQIEDRKGNDQQNKDIREKLLDKNNQRTAQVLGSASQAGQEAIDQLRLAGLDGIKREAEEARLRRDQEFRKAAGLDASAKSLGSTKDQDQVRAQAALVRQAAQSELMDRLNKLDADQMNEKIREDTERRKQEKEQSDKALREQQEQQQKFMRNREKLEANAADASQRVEDDRQRIHDSYRRTQGGSTIEQAGLLSGLAERDRATSQNDPNLQENKLQTKLQQDLVKYQLAVLQLLQNAPIVV